MNKVFPESQDDLAQHLEAAKKEGRKLRLRVSGTAGGLGAALSVFSITAVGASTPESPMYVAGENLGPPGFLLLLLTILPTDRRSTYIATSLGVLMAMCVASMCLLKIGPRADMISAGECVDSADPTIERPMWYCHYDMWRWLAYAMPYFCCGVVLSSGLRRSPRTCLDRIWRATGTVFFSTGCLRTQSFFFNSLAGRPILVSAIISAGLDLLIGTTALRPDFRRRAQAALASRGEQIATAAGIAALMGNHSVKEVLSEGRRRFMSITLDQLDFEEMKDREPNPELFQRAVSARIGEVDAFLSHSWSDPSLEKWRALNEWRERFRSTHGREPLVWIGKKSRAGHSIVVRTHFVTTTPALMYRQVLHRPEEHRL
jgi:hypothetical protein